MYHRHTTTTTTTTDAAVADAGASSVAAMRYITVILNSCAMSSSIFLAWKLMTLRELCILCFTTHLLNTLLLFHYVKRLIRWDDDGLKKRKVE